MPYQDNPQKVAARANTLRQQLLDYLCPDGPCCAECGETDPATLQVNHIYGRDWTPRKVTHYRRVLRYWREAREGLLNVLCNSCNGRYRPLPRPQPVEREATPF